MGEGETYMPSGQTFVSPETTITPGPAPESRVTILTRKKNNSKKYAEPLDATFRVAQLVESKPPTTQ